MIRLNINLRTFMKKVFLLLAIAACATFSFSSCQKLEEIIFQPFESPYTFEVTIPVVTNTTSELPMGTTNVRFNLDSVIRANTGNVFGADIVGSMHISEIGITLLDSDASNNLSNFEYVKLGVATDGTTPVVIGPLNIPAGATTTTTFALGNGLNVKSLFSGANTRFELSGKAKTATTKTLKARISAIISFEK